VILSSLSHPPSNGIGAMRNIWRRLSASDIFEQMNSNSSSAHLKIQFISLLQHLFDGVFLCLKQDAHLHLFAFGAEQVLDLLREAGVVSGEADRLGPGLVSELVLGLQQCPTLNTRFSSVSLAMQKLTLFPEW